jgi:hypothetical protein
MNVDTSKGIRHVKPKIDLEERLPLDIWNILMRFSDVSLLGVYTLLSTRYKKCVYSLPHALLRTWVDTIMMRKSARYHIDDHIAPEKLRYSTSGRTERLNILGSDSNNERYYKIFRVLNTDKHNEQLDSFILLKDKALMTKYMVYQVLLVFLHNTDTNIALRSAMVDSIVIHQPRLLRSASEELESIAVSLYTKDEILLSVYSERILAQGCTLLFTNSWQSRSYFYEYNLETKTSIPNKLTFQGRIFVHQYIASTDRYVWCESTQLANLLSKDVEQLLPDSVQTLRTMIQLSRLKPYAYGRLLPEF